MPHQIVPACTPIERAALEFAECSKKADWRSLSKKSKQLLFDESIRLANALPGSAGCPGPELVAAIVLAEKLKKPRAV